MSVHAETASVVNAVNTAKKVAVGVAKDYLVPTAITLAAVYAGNAAVKKLSAHYGK